MSAGFDPYFSWLSIHPEQQPPDHYILLGLNRFESKPEVIENAMDGRLRFLAAFANGEHGEVAQRLIHEIEAAGVCLLNPEAKVGYDKRLRSKAKKLKRAKPLVKAKPLPGAANNGASPGAAIHLAASVGQDQPGRVADFVDTSVPASLMSPAVHLRVGHRSKPSQTTVAVIVTTVAIAIILALIVIVESSSRSASKRLEQSRVASTDDSSQLPSKLSQTSTPVDGHRAGQVTGQSPPAAAEERTGDSTGGQVEAAASDPRRIQLNLPARQETSAIDARVKEAVEAVSAHANETTRRPVPEADQRNAAAVFVRDIFKADMEDAAGDRAMTATLLDEMLAHADQSSIEDAELFAVLSESRRLAIQEGLADRAIKIVERIGQTFEVSTWDIRLSTLQELRKSARSSEARKDLARTCIPLLEEATATEFYEVLPPLLDISRSAVARATNEEEVALRKDVHDREKEINVMLRAWDDLSQARKTIEDRPDDPASNLRMGKFYCLVRNDWTAGLSYLALGGDRLLSAAATKELVVPADPAAQLELANMWYDAAADVTASERGSVEAHALDWYRTCVSGLEGLKRTHAEKRIANLSPEEPEENIAARQDEPDEVGPEKTPPKTIARLVTRTAYAQFVDQNFNAVTNKGNFPHFRLNLRPKSVVLDRTVLYLRAMFQGPNTTSGIVRVEFAQKGYAYPISEATIGTWHAATINQQWLKFPLSQFGSTEVEMIEVNCLVTQGTGRIEPRVAIWAIDPDL